MKKLIYLIVLIVVLGLIVAGCTSVVPPVEQGELDNLEMISVSKSVMPVVIDGDVTPDEWGTYHLGTSVTTWGGGMSVDVYGYADDTYLYAAYVADMAQPGWSNAAGMCISANLDYQTPQSASWPDIGYTHISVYGDGFAQTDGSGWDWPDGWGNTGPSVFTSRGIEYYVGEPCYGSPYPNTAEIKIPLSLLTYAGADGQIMLGGQYWQYDWATPFLVEIEVEDTIAPLVTIERPKDGDIVSGIVDIYGTIVEEIELSHYNIAIYHEDDDFRVSANRLEQRTVSRSTGFDNEQIYQWDTTYYENGWYLIRLAARDKAGNRDVSQDPYAGGDDSQHVIRVLVRNTEEVPIDIKPTSCPNPINVKSKGVLPVAILGTADFNVAEIDPETVFLEGVSPLRWALKDVATPKDETMECNTLGPDGVLDLTLKFDVQEIITALDDVEDGQELTLTLTGNLVDGTPIAGEDVVRILIKGKQ